MSPKVNALLILILGVYSIGGFIALIRSRWSDRTLTKRIMIELSVVYVGCICQISFETLRSFWDCFHVEHFPLKWSNAVLIGLFLLYSHSTYSVWNRIPAEKP